MVVSFDAIAFRMINFLPSIFDLRRRGEREGGREGAGRTLDGEYMRERPEPQRRREVVNRISTEARSHPSAGLPSSWSSPPPDAIRPFWEEMRNIPSPFTVAVSASQRLTFANAPPPFWSTRVVSQTCCAAGWEWETAVCQSVSQSVSQSSSS